MWLLLRAFSLGLLLSLPGQAFASTAAKELLSVYVDHRPGTVEISVQSSVGYTNLRYYDLNRLPAGSRKFFVGTVAGWNNVHLLEGEDRRWELKVVEQLTQDGWQLESQQYAIALGSVFGETFTQLEREIRNTYLFSRPMLAAPILDTLYLARGDVSQDSLDEIFTVVQDARLVKLDGEMGRSLVVSYSDTGKEIVSSAIIPGFAASKKLPDPMREMSVIDGKLAITLQPERLRQLNTYYFTYAPDGMILSRVEINGLIQRATCYYDSKLDYNLKTGRVIGPMILTECEGLARTAPQVQINESTPVYRAQYLRNFVPGAQYFKLKRIWKEKVYY